MTDQPDLIDRLLKSAESRYAPDTKNWNPETQVDSHMRVAADGRWFHMGSEIKRRKMVALFSSILRREGDDHFLVTPVEKARIEVEDTPFLIVDFEADGRGQESRLVLKTNVEEWVPIKLPNQLFMMPLAGDESACPCADLRDGLLGRFTRAANFRLAELLVERNGWLGVWSYGNFYALDRGT